MPRRRCTAAVVGLGALAVVIPLAHAGQPASSPAASGLAESRLAPVSLDEAKFACPMEAHPDEPDPVRQGAYLSLKPGTCEWCGMTLRPAEELDWVRARRAAQGGDMAYTCPVHQHVYSAASGRCPRCDRALQPFRVMYCCPEPQHSTIVRATPGACPHDGRALAPFRGVWLSPEMSGGEAPPTPGAARRARFGCPLHPLVASDVPANCPVCARELSPDVRAHAATQTAIPPDAAFVCPMQECEHFSIAAGTCPKCGMALKPLADVRWVRTRRVPAASEVSATPRLVCPMHPGVGSDSAGACPVCGMQLVAVENLPQPLDASAAIRTQMDYLMEHYLELHRRFAADSERDVALHALGLVGAADEILRQAQAPRLHLPQPFAQAAVALRTAALRLTGKSLQDDRVTFVALGSALREMTAHVRPSPDRYPTLYIFHCPITKGDWLQSTDDMANPFYGFEMLKCGELVQTR